MKQFQVSVIKERGASDLISEHDELQEAVDSAIATSKDPLIKCKYAGINAQICVYNTSEFGVLLSAKFRRDK